MSLTGLSNLRAAGLRLELSLSAALHNGPLAVDHGQECKIILANKPQEVQKVLSPRTLIATLLSALSSF